ncbi:MAG: serine hydrolase [Thalassobaculaceae bacterium]|uniref:serine hydrolase domain-containing protein n=1 Tax=Roseitalea porphyridii TaxID=1852022 RepID=UPI0032ECC9D6
MSRGTTAPTRRHVALGAAAALGAPFVLAGMRSARARTADLGQAARAFPRLHTVLVQQGDDLILAETLRGPGAERVANVKSVSKSIVALLLGIAIGRGDVPDVRARLIDVAPDIVPPNATPGVEDLTLEDLVTMRAGLAATSGRAYGAWVGSTNWIAYVLRQEMVARPGGRMIYSTGSTHVLGAALAVAAGESLLTQARTRLADPLGIAIPAWTRDPQGFYLGGNQMALTPAAMLRIAATVRDGGRFAGTQVIPSGWVDASARPRTRSPWSGLGYGYGWFLSETGYMIARGYGGQVIAAHPGRGLAVAITSDPDRPARSRGYFGDLMAFLDGPVLQAADARS